jgi:hypothetical protein
LDRAVLSNLTGRVADPDPLGSAIILEAGSAFRFAIERKAGFRSFRGSKWSHGGRRAFGAYNEGWRLKMEPWRDRFFSSL